MPIEFLHEADCDLSIVIVSYNTRADTLACLSSLAALGDRASRQVIVVDNASSDGSLEAVQSQHPGVIAIDGGRNGGFAYGCNRGIERARGEYILLLNPDTLVPDGTLDAVLGQMRDHPEIGILGPRIVYPDGSHQNSVIRDLSLRTLAGLVCLPSRFVVATPLLGDHRYGSLDHALPARVDNVMGSFMLFRRELVERIGGLDERFFMYGEECEFSWRARRVGLATLYWPQAVISHVSGASTQELGVFRAVEMTRGHILFLRFTRGAGVAWIGTLLMLMRDIARGPVHLARYVAGGLRAAPSTRAWALRTRFLLRAMRRLPTLDREPAV